MGISSLPWNWFPCCSSMDPSWFIINLVSFHIPSMLSRTWNPRPRTASWMNYWIKVPLSSAKLPKINGARIASNIVCYFSWYLLTRTNIARSSRTWFRKASSHDSRSLIGRTSWILHQWTRLQVRHKGPERRGQGYSWSRCEAYVWTGKRVCTVPHERKGRPECHQVPGALWLSISPFQLPEANLSPAFCPRRVLVVISWCCSNIPTGWQRSKSSSLRVHQRPHRDPARM